MVRRFVSAQELGEFRAPKNPRNPHRDHTPTPLHQHEIVERAFTPRSVTTQTEDKSVVSRGQNELPRHAIRDQCGLGANWLNGFWFMLNMGVSNASCWPEPSCPAPLLLPPPPPRAPSTPTLLTPAPPHPPSCCLVQLTWRST